MISTLEVYLDHVFYTEKKIPHQRHESLQCRPSLQHFKKKIARSTMRLPFNLLIPYLLVRSIRHLYRAGVATRHCRSKIATPCHKRPTAAACASWLASVTHKLYRLRRVCDACLLIKSKTSQRYSSHRGSVQLTTPGRSTGKNG